mgnify:CR=1 FL=1
MFDLKKWLNDSNLIRDIKTVVSFLLAYAIAVISNGLIEDFTPASLISVAVTLGALGTFFAIRIITNEFTERGMYDEEQSNEELQKILKEQRVKSGQIKSSKAYDILLRYNEQKLEYLKKTTLQKNKNKYEVEIKRLESLIKHVEMTKNLRWFNRINKFLVSRLKRRKNKVSKKLANLSLNNVRVKYKPVQLHHLKTSDVQDNEEKFSEADRFRITPQKKIRKQLAATNFVKTFFIVGFQGAAIATITSWTAFLIFLVLITLSLATTAVSSYVGTRRYANMNYISILQEKVEKIDWLNQEVEALEKSQAVSEANGGAKDAAERLSYEKQLNEFYEIN